MITVAIWVYWCKGFRQARMPMISKETSVSQFAVHSYSYFEQERLFRTPADTIGQHHNKRNLKTLHDTWEAFTG